MKNLFAAALAALALAACAPADSNVLTFATDATWPPMEFVNDQKELVGFDIDLAREIAKEAGFEVKFEVVAWDGIFAGLDNNAYDAVISSVTINAERQAQYDFSTPYVQAGQVLLVRANEAEITSLTQLNGQPVGAQISTAGAIEVRKYPQVTLKEYSEVGLAIQDLVNGNVRAVVLDSPVAADYALVNPAFAGQLKVVGDLMTSEDFGVVVKKGNARVLELINKGLAAVQANGKLAELKAKWSLK